MPFFIRTLERKIDAQTTVYLLLEDLNAFMEENFSELRRYFKIRDLKTFTRDDLELYVIYLRGVIDRTKEKSGGPPTLHAV